MYVAFWVRAYASDDYLEGSQTLQTSRLHKSDAAYGLPQYLSQ